MRRCSDADFTESEEKRSFKTETLSVKIKFRNSRNKMCVVSVAKSKVIFSPFTFESDEDRTESTERRSFEFFSFLGDAIKIIII